MKNTTRKRGQKFLRRFSRASLRASEEGKEHIKENLVARISHVENIRLLIVEWSLLMGALILLASTQAFWFSESYAEDIFVDGGTYTEATLGDVKSMNPLFSATDSEKTLSRLMFEGISTIDYSGHAGIGLAQSIRSDDTGSVWTVKLRDGLTWSDGEPITNKDVLFTAGLIKNPAVNSVYSSNLEKVKVYENEDGSIIFELPSAYADFITALDFPILPEHILGHKDPQNLVEDGFSNSPVTSGAFSYNAVQTTSGGGEKVFYLVANPTYYKGRPMLNSFAIHTYNTKDDIIDAINSGEVTATAELTAAEQDKIISGQFTVKKTTLNAGAFIFFNTKSDQVKQRDLRAAIRQGINLDKMREAAGDVTVIDYPILESQIRLSRYPEIPTQNITEAKSKITEMSSETKIHLSIATVNSGFLPKVAEAVKNDLESLGIEVDLTSYDETQDFITNVIAGRSYDILIYEIALGTEPDLLPYYHSSQANSSGLNLSNYHNALVDDILLSARDKLTSDLKIKKYESFLDYWTEDVPAIALYQSELSYYYNRNVQTFNNDLRLVSPYDRFTDVGSWGVVRGNRNKTP